MRKRWNSSSGSSSSTVDTRAAREFGVGGTVDTHAAQEFGVGGTVDTRAA